MNIYNLPFIRNILEVTRLLFDSYYVGYVNSDIVFGSNLFYLVERALQARPRLGDIVICVWTC